MGTIKTDNRQNATPTTDDSSVFGLVGEIDRKRVGAQVVAYGIGDENTF